MAASSKFDLSSSSPDGPTYPNGQRGLYAAASLERSGSFREAMENRMPSSLPNMSRAGMVSSQADTGNLFQSLLADLKAVVLDQKVPRPGELKRAITSIIGASSEESIPAMLSTRHFPSSSVDEIKRMKSNLQESSIKARDRVKAFGEAALKIDKYCQNLSRKRSRADASSGERSNTLLSGGSISKTSPQSHLNANGLEHGPQKSEERTKNATASRRVRTSMVEARMDVRANSSARPSGPADRDRDIAKSVNSSVTLSEDKGRGLPTGVDGWEKSKMKKKRSVIKSDASSNAVLARPLDGDREAKRGLQQKLGSDARLRVNNAQGFRSGPASGVNGVGKLDSTTQQNGLGMRPLPRSDQDNDSLPNSRKDRFTGLDKEGVTLKAALKPSGREDNSAASPSSITKVNAAPRGPRSNSGSVSKASPNIHRTSGSSDDWEHPQSMNKLNPSGAINRKRSTTARSSSPPVAQWVVQRPPKMQRIARRSNLTPLMSGHDEPPTSDTVDNASVIDDGPGVTRRLSSTSAQQVKSKVDTVQSAGFSESEESGVINNKSKDKNKKCETEDNVSQAAQKVSTVVVPSRKNKVAAENDDVGDGGRRQGRIGRGFTSPRSFVPASVEKSDNSATPKQLRSARIGSERIESKPGRPPTKKFSERKGYTRPRHLVNNAPLEFAGESDDDHEELLAAANDALNTRRACSSSFWKQIEPVFAFLSPEDISFLNEQIRLTDEFAMSTCAAGDNGQNLKGGLEYNSLPSTPAVASREDHGAVSIENSFSEGEREATLAWQTEHVEPFLEQLVREIGAQRGVSICQALLSAIIEEEEIGDIDYSNSKAEEYFHDSYGNCYDIEAEMKFKDSNFQSSRPFAVERGPSNGFRGNAGWRYHDELAHEKLGSNGGLLNSSIACSEFQYNEMCINDRILLELSEIGLYPEPVPDLAQSEDEDISEGMKKLEEMLREQVLKKKSMLLKLEKAVAEAREHQQRELEHVALDRLVRIAYDKYMAYWAPSASGSKNVNKLGRHAALAFVKRTLVRCHKFEGTGASCFDEPAFRDLFSYVSSNSSGAEGVDIAADGEVANCLTPALHPQGYGSSMMSKPVQRSESRDKYSDAFRSVNHLSEQTIGKEEPWSNRVKKRELLLDDVVGSTVGTALRASSGLGSSLVSNTKGKRSERDREGKGQNRDAGSKNGIARIGRPALSNVKGERKNKTKPKQKTAQLSASVNGLLKAAEPPNTLLPSASKSRETVVGGSTKKDDLALVSSSRAMQDIPNDAEAMDLGNLQLPEIDVGDFGGQGQDIGSWLNIDDDGLQDHDFMGLEIPMDDLSEVNMMI